MTDSLQWDGSEAAQWTLLLSHGAGASTDSLFFKALTQGLIERADAIGGLRVARFDFPYMEARRRTGHRRPPDALPKLLDRYRSVIRGIGGSTRRLVIGGKSMGGRVASMVADECGVAGLVCFGYPFHPPGKPESLRTAHLRDLRTPTLICQGTRDPFGRADEVEHYGLSPVIRIHWLDDGDHSLKPRKKSGRSEAQNLAEALDAVIEFIGALPWTAAEL